MTGSVTHPIQISLQEWSEIIQLEYVRESWGLTEETAEEFSNWVYGVKFNFRSGSPGYCGELFIIQGDILTGDQPLLLGRREGTLVQIYT